MAKGINPVQNYVDSKVQDLVNIGLEIIFNAFWDNFVDEPTPTPTPSPSPSPTPTPTEKKNEEESGVCIDWNEIVSIKRNGVLYDVPLKNVKIGDLVMSLNENNQVDYVPIIMLTNHTEKTYSVFKLIAQSQSGEIFTQQIVGKHFIPIFNENGFSNSRLVAVHNIKRGDHLQIFNRHTQATELATITEISQSYVEGVIHIWTTSLNHFANGVLTSCQTEGDYGAIAHIMAAKCYEIHHDLPRIIFEFVTKVLK